MVPKKRFARVIIRNDNGEFLIVNQTKGGYNFPGGKIEPNESPEDAVRRETMEETGVELGNLKQLCNEDFPLGKDLWDGFFFIALDYKGIPSNKEPNKLSEVFFCSKEFARENGSKMFVADILDKLEKFEKKSTLRL